MGSRRFRRTPFSTMQSNCRHDRPELAKSRKKHTIHEHTIHPNSSMGISTLPASLPATSAGASAPTLDLLYLHMERRAGTTPPAAQ